MPAPKSRSYPRFRHRVVSSAISSRSAQPSRTARRAASGTSIGSLKKSWTPSPSRKPTVASNRFTRPPIVPWNSPSTRISSSGSTASTKFRPAAEGGKEHRDLPTVAGQDRLVSGRHDRVGDVRREEPTQPPQALELLDLSAHALLEREVELLDLVVIALDAEQRPDPREQLVVG